MADGSWVESRGDEAVVEYGGWKGTFLEASMGRPIGDGRKLRHFKIDRGESRSSRGYCFAV